MTTEKEIKAAVGLICGHGRQLTQGEKNALMVAIGGKKLREALTNLLARVDERCGGRAEGNSGLIKACDEARSLIAEWRGGL